MVISVTYGSIGAFPQQEKNKSSNTKIATNFPPHKAPDLKFFPWPSERLTHFGIIQPPSEGPHWTPSVPYCRDVLVEFQGAFNWAPITPRGASNSEVLGKKSKKCPGQKPLTKLPSELQIHSRRTFFFRNLIKSTRNQIVFTILRSLWIQTNAVRLHPNRSENGKYNLISGWFNKISRKKILCVSEALPPGSKNQCLV